MSGKSKYNPQIHHRRSIRLRGYDYSQAGLYFITICCQDRKCRFGKIVGAGLAPTHEKPESQGRPQVQGRPPGSPQRMELNQFGIVAYNEWIKLSERFPNFQLDVFQIMPNHMHGIILLNNVGAGLAPAREKPENPGQWQGVESQGRPQGSPQQSPRRIGDIVGAYKSIVAIKCLEIFKSNHLETGLAPDQIPIMGKLWQRDYYEHIIRNEKAYQNISEYIINNPSQWSTDKFYK